MLPRTLCLFLWIISSCSPTRTEPIAPSPSLRPVYLVDNKTGGDMLGSYKRISPQTALYFLPDTFRISYSPKGGFLMHTQSLELVCFYEPQGRYLQTSVDSLALGFTFETFTLFDHRPDDLRFTLYGQLSPQADAFSGDTLKARYRKIN